MGKLHPHGHKYSNDLELAKKPPECLDYVGVREEVHILEHKHKGRFVALMDRPRPQR